MKSMLNEQDKRQIEEKGISREQFLQQIEQFKKGFPSITLDRPATAGDGVIRVDASESSTLMSFFNDHAPEYRMLKFVPASGAATRMFKDLYLWRDLLKAGVEPEELLKNNEEAAVFFGRMRENAFWQDLKLVMDKDDLDADHLLDTFNFLPLLDYLLYDAGLDYAELPKALIAFHTYGQQVRTAMEEHLAEGALYVADESGRVRIHFTLSPEHIPGFKQKLNAVRSLYESNYSVTYDIGWSIQKPSTDTIAVDIENLPFREKDGSLLFRPGGHGSLIENLQDLTEYDLIFIKNIDNVAPDRIKEESIKYKKILGSLLIGLQRDVYKWLRKLDRGSLTQAEYSDSLDFAINKLNIDKNVFSGTSFSEGVELLRKLLARPIRVCGMVKNEGEPGGGPFWVKDKNGFRSLQIVEMSQINMKDPQQESIVRQATHFNPVDMVCSIKDHNGKIYDLHQFIDPDTGFISIKSKNGQELKALERPGLWNGAMANWITIFVEVPLITFNPVKTINDLLRPEHQNIEPTCM